MITKQEKLDAITRFAPMVGQNPQLTFLVGYLMGQIERVNFVDSLKDAEIAVRLSARTAAVWPHEPFRASVRGVSMPNTVILVGSIREEDTPICVSLDFDHAEDTPWYQAVLLPGASYVKNAAETAQVESDLLWEEMNRTLDIYRTTKSALADDPSRSAELQYYMSVAEEQMKRLSHQMEELSKHMQRIADREARQ